MRGQILKVLFPYAKYARKILGFKFYRILKEIIFRVREHDEVEAIYRALGNTLSGRGIMLDVGGHRGESFEPFADEGWKIYTFEPNPENHPIIKERASRFGNQVHLIPLAVSESSKNNLPFYVSGLSTGISSLHAFHETHEERFTVSTISLSEFTTDNNIEHVDLLKIDVEGHDFFVLKGVDWAKCIPEVIICEFEDKKTLPLGYGLKDMADYLVDKGYKIIISEWKPVSEYGQFHEWLRHSSYPCEPLSPDAWGNIIAIRSKVYLERITNELGIVI